MPNSSLPCACILALTLPACVVPKILGENDTDSTSIGDTETETDTGGPPICGAGQGGTPGGELLWSLAGADLPAFYTAVQVNAAEQIALAGTEVLADSDRDVHVTLLEADGALAWSEIYAGPNGLTDSALDLVVDGAGTIHVLVRETILELPGDPEQGIAGTSDARLVVLRYAADGALQWRWEQTHPPVAEGEVYTPFGALAHADAGVSVLVRAHDEAPALIRLDALGVALSEVTLAAPAGLSVEQQALTADGAAILAGDLELPLGQHALWVGRFAGDGSLAWSDSFGGLDDTPTALIPASDDGEVLMAWSTSGPGGIDNSLRRYDPAGATLWTVALPLSGLDSGVSGGARRCDGVVLLTGSTDAPPAMGSTWGFRRELWVGAYAADGAQLWARDLGFGALESNGQANDVASAADGDAIVVGGFTSESDQGPWLGRFTGG